jgi:sugar phosphate isomerase/epimerase
MAWRIGEVLDIDAQLAWIAASGFTAASFHASAGVAGQWRGVDPKKADGPRRAALRRRLAGFASREIHAPFGLVLGDKAKPDTVDGLAETLRFAGDVGADVVTVHADPPRAGRPAGRWQRDLDRLNGLARQARVRVGLELTRGFDWLRRPARPNIGLTLDVGHMYLNGAAALRPFGTIGQAVGRQADVLIHLHVHDYDGRVDHIEPGTGRVDFEDLISSLAAVGYAGALCLELNPQRCSPAGMRRSAAFLRRRAAAVGQ